MQHILCIIRHAQAHIERVNGALVDRDLTPEGEEQSRRIVDAIQRRYGTSDLNYDASKEKRAVDTATLVSTAIGGGKPVLEAPYMDTSVLPFINELARRIRSTDSWWGVFLLFGHYAFLDAGYREAIESFGYRCLGSVPRDFEYGSMVILDVDARTVEYVPNGQP